MTATRTILSSLAIAITASAPMPIAAQRQLDLPRPSWEHQCLSTPARGKTPALARLVEAEANQRGSEGWVLSSFARDGDNLLLCFARPQVVVNTEVTRIPEGSPRPELSGNWTELDSKEAAERIVADCFTDPKWLGGKSATLRIGGVKNKTDEHLDARAILNQVEKEIIATKKLRVLSSDSRGNEGADYVVTLDIISLLDQVEGVRIKHYQVAAQVIRTLTGEKVCIGSAEITKSITRPAAVW